MSSKIKSALDVLSGLACSLGLIQRPQHPRDRSYGIRSVSFQGGSQDVHLEGELTVPHGEGGFPAVILITGSGPQNRDEALAGHKPFLILSDFLTRHGFAVLRYDDRGVGKSTGEFSKATPEDFAADAVAAFHWLKNQPGVDADRMGYLGHSEGGYVAPMAALDSSPAFMVFLAGPALPLLPDVMEDQARDILSSIDCSDAIIDKAVAQVHQSREILRNSESEEEAKAVLLDSFKNDAVSILTGKKPNAYERKLALSLWASPWGRWYAEGYDPHPALKDYENPVLALYGGSDLQVSASRNAPIMETLLSNHQSEVVVFDDMNHLFQISKTGRINDYLKIKTTIEEPVLRKIVDWLEGLEAKQ